MTTPERDDESDIRRMLAESAEVLNPRPPAVAAVRAAGRRRRRRRVATGTGVSLAVAGAVAAAVVVTLPPRMASEPSPAGQTTSASTVATTGLSPTPASSPPHSSPIPPGAMHSGPSAPASSTRKVVKPWHTVLLGSAMRFDTLLGDGDWLYGVRHSVETGAVTSVVRINPVTLKQSPTPLQGVPVVDGDSLWTVRQIGTSDRYRLNRYDQKTLATTLTTIVRLPATQKRGVEFHAVASGGPLYLAGLDTTKVAVINAATGHVTHRWDLSGGVISGFAAAPDGSAVYVVSGRIIDQELLNKHLIQLDPTSGDVVWKIPFGGVNGATLVASRGGVWYEAAEGGMNSNMTGFIPANGDPAGRQTFGPSGGGMIAFPTVSGKAAWISGGLGTVICADPRTGKIWDKATFYSPRHPAALKDITVAGGGVFGLYEGPREPTLARVHPPAACRQ